MFREMRYVYEVYRERSFSRAAQKLYISQPSLSLMIKKAEERVGSPLFDRSTMPIGLTEAGRQYIRAAEQIMEIEGSFQQYISDTEACLSGTLALGGTTLFTSYVLPPLISAFSDRFPRVQVRILEAHTAALERELREGELDFVMENCAFDPAVYDSIAYRAERLLLAVPASFAINEAAAAYRLTAEELQAGRDAPGRAAGAVQGRALSTAQGGQRYPPARRQAVRQSGLSPRRAAAAGSAADGLQPGLLRAGALPLSATRWPAACRPTKGCISTC